MKVILTADVAKLGKKGDVVNVSEGYFNNFLLPRKTALPASSSNLKNLDAMIKSAVLRESRELAKIEEIKQAISERTYVVRAKAGPSGKLFGSITAADVAKSIQHATKVEIDKRRVELADPIRAVGSYTIAIKLHPEVEAQVTVEVQSEA